MKKLFLYLGTIAYLLVGQTERAMAQSEDFGTDVLSGLVTAGGTRSLFDIVTGIVNIVLYFLGAIAILLGLYAGWLWFSSRGNAEQIRKAKAILASAIIGLVIIFASYAITNFVVRNIYNAINPDPSDISGGSGGGGTTGIVACPPPETAGDMEICSFSPTSKPVGGFVTISGWNFGDYVDAATSRVNIGSTAATLVSCGTSPYWRERFTRDDGNVYYRVKVIVPNLTPGTYPIEVINGATLTDTIAGFNVSSGLPGPSIACFDPEEGQRGTDVVAYGTNFGTAGTRTITMTGWDSAASAAAPINVAYTTWTDTEISFRIPDNALASEVFVTNDTFAADPTDSEYFQVTCDATCSAVCCRLNECRPANICSGTVEISGPRISNITPNNSAIRNLITIQGSGFGNVMGTGHVEFVDSSNVEVRALLPNSAMMNPSCANLWTNTDIIVGVPDTLSVGTYRVRVYPNSSIIASNDVNFVVNTINRPGICLADPVSGSLNNEVEITGVGFVDDTGNTVKYGGIAGYNTNIDEAADTATSNVPNLRNGLVGIQLNAGTNVSNPYPFNITESIAGDPNIVTIDPINGPAGTYLTINGTNFGNSRGVVGNVLFGTVSANFTFPLQCSSSIWSSSRIIVKVPTGLTDGTNYDLKVIRSDGKESNTKVFTATTGTPRPGICAIFPDNGPENTLVDLYGDNFGVALGDVKFFNEKNTTAAVWNNNVIQNAPVPNDAETGPVSIVTSDAQPSINGLNFRVGSCARPNDCNTSIGETCCQNSIGNYCAVNCTNTRMCSYGWSFTTVATPAEELRVVDHWPACDSSCGNSEIGVGFNVPVIEATAENVDNYLITDITNPASPVNVTINSATLTQNLDDSVPAEVRLAYVGPLVLNHRYEVRVGYLTAVQNITSLENEELSAQYVWAFTVGQGICDFTGVNIRPANYTAYRPNQTISYTAAPTADVSTCGAQRLTCEGCSYNWQINPSPVIASISSGATARDMKARSTSITIPSTVSGSNNVQCQITQSPSNIVSANTSLSIDYRSYLESLVVTEHYPDCSNACTNSVVGMHFNSAIDTTTVGGGNISLTDMDTGTNITSSVVALVNNTVIPSSESVFEINHTVPFVSGHRYRVLISTAVENMFGNSLSVPFEWYFTVGTEECAVTGATVSPASVTANARNQSIGYVSQTTSNTISCGNIPVNCTTCTYGWSSTIPTVATISGSLTSKNTRATVAATANTGDSTNIACQVTQGARPPITAVPGLLNVTLNTAAYTIPFIEDFSPKPPGVTAQCLNSAVEIIFSEKMNLDSIRNNLKLFDASNNPVAGNFYFATVDRTKTKVLFAPTAILVSNSVYHISLGTGLPPAGIISANGVPLDFTTAPIELVNNGWTFTTGTEICKISYVLTSPSDDWFTCGGNSCEGDEDASVDGNQHRYFATPYSRQATPIIGASFRWQANPSDNSIVSINNVNSQEVTTTAETENGEARVSVTASGTISGVDLGSASASTLVTVFLCQNPWPNMDSFPWRQVSTNFSTYYCARFDDSSTSLPYLSYPPRATLPANNPDIASGKILAEYILTVNISGATSKNNSLGSLAYYLPTSSKKEQINLWQRISKLTEIKQARGQSDDDSIPIPVPTVFPSTSVNVSANGSVVTVSWTLPRRTTPGIYDHFEVQRKLSAEPISAWSEMLTIPGDTTQTRWTWTDTLTADGSYDYRIVSFGVDGTISATTAYSIEFSSVGSETNFIIFRVMPNTEHLSISEWYKTKFPGDALGTMTTVDGYEAMRVGNTIYISAANIGYRSGISYVFTNIYIIAYSIGANAQTKAIYDQFVDNFQLNTNSNFSAINDDNLCTVADADGNYPVCLSDFDCPTGGLCKSRSLKLRRDVKRLTDLLPVKKYLTQYGEAHKACSGNGQISCTADSDCGTVGPCVNYYPQLSAGTFVPGKTNSKWPSWQQTLASDLRQSLPVDPINRFTECPDPEADPATCWNEASRTFQCELNSSIYGYQLGNNGKTYTLDSNFEYDPISYLGTIFDDDLYNGDLISPGINSLGNINTTLLSYCVGSPSLPGNGNCGNGRRDPGEECDGGFLDNICQRSPADPELRGLGLSTRWWNEQSTGCNPPGTPEQCQWYQPTLTAGMCGGYCRDNILQNNYESCDLNSSGALMLNGIYHCPTATPDTYNLVSGAANCNSSCNVTCPIDSLPAARCGDGVWTANREACDPTAYPNGLAAWDCPNNGNVQCGSLSSANACGISCDNGATPYRGLCGNGTIEAPELCDYGNYPTPFPATADANHRYTCSQGCNFVDQLYCGDARLQYGYGERCDTNLLVPVLPRQSSATNQYECRMSNDPRYETDPLYRAYTRCTLTAGGYCGDGIVQNGIASPINYGERCDPLNHFVSVADSRPENQYQCQTDCMSTFGGYCGNGTVESTEQCDAGTTPTIKKAEVVIVFDVSRSLATAAGALCTSLDQVLSGTSLPGFEYKITVMAMGDSDSDILTSAEVDNISLDQLVDDSLQWQMDAHTAVFDALVTSCPTYAAHRDPTQYASSGNQLRYLSFYDRGSNNIGDVTISTSDDNFNNLAGCNDKSTISPGGRLENWGYATQKIIESYNWLPDYQRIIMPVSDEYAWCGGDVRAGDLARANENFVVEAGSEDILVDIVDAANATTPMTHISPVILMVDGGSGVATTVAQGSDNQRLGGLIADATGGMSSNVYTNWAANLVRVINSAFCDQDGDGTMDCLLP